MGLGQISPNLKLRKSFQRASARASISVFLILFLGSVELLAANSPPSVPSNCASSFAALARDINRPTQLARSEQVPLLNKVLDVERLRRHVKVVDIGSNSKIGDLQDGTYLYVIDGNRRLAIMDRLVDPGAQNLADPAAQFLGSHEGLVTHLKAAFKEEPTLYAAGEVVVRNGRVLMFSNGAGTYRGTQEHLDYAIREMRNAGVEIDSRTELRNYAKKKYSDPHGTANSQARVALETKRDPTLMSLVLEARSVMRKLDDRFPKPEDIVHAAIAIRDPEKQGEVLQAVGLFAQWQTPQESEFYVIQNANRSMGTEKLRKALKSLRELAP